MHVNALTEAPAPPANTIVKPTAVCQLPTSPTPPPPYSLSSCCEIPPHTSSPGLQTHYTLQLNESTPPPPLPVTSTGEEVRLHSGKGAGPDGVSPRVFKVCAHPAMCLQNEPESTEGPCDVEDVLT